MYSKMFELINDKLNSLHLNSFHDGTSTSALELVKIEIQGIKVKFVFLETNLRKMQIMRYELDWLSSEPKLKFKKVYFKPFKEDKNV